MAAGFPNAGMHDNRCLQADDIFSELNHCAPPMVFDVPLKFGPQGSVIPKTLRPAVDFGGLKNEAPSFAERNDFFHQLTGFRLDHEGQSVLEGKRGVKGGMLVEMGIKRRSRSEEHTS